MKNRTQSPVVWLISLAFWLALFTAAGLYAVVALSPKVVTFLEEQEKYRTNQQQLVWLEQQVLDQKRVAAALQNEPEFAAEVARMELNATRPGDERIPVDGDLVKTAVAKTPHQSLVLKLPWYMEFLQIFNEQQEWRRYTLTAAALLALFAFMILQPSQEQRLRRAVGGMAASARGVGHGFRWLSDRYARPPKS